MLKSPDIRSPQRGVIAALLLLVFVVRMAEQIFIAKPVQ
jgi:hypothetical protein